MTGIYKIVNQVNGKMYVGKTKTTFKKRWYAHKYELRRGNYGCRILQRAWNKYGEENFKFEIIAEGNFTSKELSALEEIFIKLYGNYNIKKVSKTSPQSKETRQKLSKAHKEIWSDSEYKKQRVKNMYTDAWDLYPEVVEYWRHKANGRGGNTHPGTSKIQNKFKLARGIVDRMLTKIKQDSSINIVEGYSKQAIYEYWSNPVNANQAKYKHPGRRDIAKTFNISEHIAEDLIKEFTN